VTFAVKYRGGATARAEYHCPIHGVFEATVERDAAGDPAATAPCPEDGGNDEWCDYPAPWTITAAPAKLTVYGQVRMGKVQKPDHPLSLDTSELGEGMPYYEWKLKREKLKRDFAEKQLKMGRDPW
jgi:hypothetical protein